MDIERDAIGWRQILVGYGLVALIFGGMGAALLSTQAAQSGADFEMAAAGVVVAIIVLDMVFRRALTRAFVWLGLSPMAEFRLKVCSVFLLCLLSLAACALGVAVSMRINA
ncbi:hypothetical protein IBL26_13665 [Roseomonas aerophila]|uniref:Uncharacterized protein n=1 Tax=Teichococcus aerophilus TaxID=1224513 RepID=A0ABR7RMV6_9PROT|nr:hypothetical protein [Pseudoroseomonas aerophila]MBC9207887.1 hypothetical protein [Pseudoroseomonas aerophila]